MISSFTLSLTILLHIWMRKSLTKTTIHKFQIDATYSRQQTSRETIVILVSGHVEVERVSESFFLSFLLTIQVYSTVLLLA